MVIDDFYFTLSITFSPYLSPFASTYPHFFEATDEVKDKAVVFYG